MKELPLPEDIPSRLDNQSPDTHRATTAFSERPLTPIDKCLEVGLPAERRRTAAGALVESDFQSCDYLFGAAILAHAKVYTFAQHYLASELEHLALQRLIQVLISVGSTQAHLILDIVHTVHHIYDNTTVRASQEEPARRLLSHFVALN